MTERKNRTDSTTGKMQAIRGAKSTIIQPPAHVRLREQDLPYWADIVAARAADSWNPSDLTAAAQLARCRADIERFQDELDREPPILYSEKGTAHANPKFSIIEQLVRRQQALMRIVYVHAQATLGSTGTAANKSKAQREAQGKLEKKDDDGKDRSLLRGRSAQPALKAVK